MEEGLGGNPGFASVIGTHLTSRDSVSSLSVGSDDKRTFLRRAPCLGSPWYCAWLERESVPSDSVIVSAPGTRGGVKLGWSPRRCVSKDLLGTPFSAVGTRGFPEENRWSQQFCPRSRLLHVLSQPTPKAQAIPVCSTFRISQESHLKHYYPCPHHHFYLSRNTLLVGLCSPTLAFLTYSQQPDHSGMTLVCPDPSEKKQTFSPCSTPSLVSTGPLSCPQDLSLSPRRQSPALDLLQPH